MTWELYKEIEPERLSMKVYINRETNKMSFEIQLDNNLLIDDSLTIQEMKNLNIF